MRVAGQLRFAPGGAVIGIDMNVAISMAEALGYDTAAIIDLLPYGEAGLIEGLIKSSDEGDPSQ